MGKRGRNLWQVIPISTVQEEHTKNKIMLPLNRHQYSSIYSTNNKAVTSYGLVSAVIDLFAMHL